MRIAFAALMLSLAAASGTVSAQDDKKALEPVQGTWIVVGVVDNGEEAPKIGLEAGNFKWTIKDDQATFVQLNVARYYSFVLDPTKSPPSIDMTITKMEYEGKEIPKAAGKVFRGIYEVKDDVLRICVREDSQDSERPSEFTSPKGSKIVVFTLERARP